LCIATVIAELKKYAFFQSSSIRNVLKALHAADGVIALLLGLALYYESPTLLLIGLICITKFFLLHLLSRMVTGQVAHGRFAVGLQTTKTFLHHVGSFVFLNNPSAALVTGIWRFISMNGHAAMTLRDKLDPKLYNNIMWKITHARNAVVVFILFLCFYNREVRRGFGKSF
jgi:hypothetical protein